CRKRSPRAPRPYCANDHYDATGERWRMRVLLVFLAGLLVGANAVYFLMTWGDADPDAAVVFARERSQHTEVVPEASATTTEPPSSVDPARQPVTPPPTRVDAAPLSPPLSTAPPSTGSA